MRDEHFAASDKAEAALTECFLVYKKALKEEKTNKQAFGIDLADLIANSFNEAGFSLEDRQEVVTALVGVLGSEHLLQKELEDMVHFLSDTMANRRRDAMRPV